MDSLHMHLFAAVDQLESAVEAHMPRRRVTDAVLDVLLDVGDHFAEEEAFMQEVRHPRLAEQRLAYERFAQDVTRAATEFLSDRGASAEPLVGCVRAWLESHVADHDGTAAERS